MSTQLDLVHTGQHATYGVGSDRYPYIVVKHSSSKKTIWLQPLKAIPTPECDHVNQEYTYEKYNDLDDSATRKATLRKDGKYRWVGDNHSVVHLGYANKYIDPHF